MAKRIPSAASDADNQTQLRASDEDAAIVVSESAHLPVVPGYAITGHLGEGGMADVWLAQDETLGRKVAVKTMSAELSTEAEFVDRFAEEAKIVAGFRHNHIVTVFARGETDSHHWIAMEYIAGGTLGDRLIEGPLSPQQSLEITCAMAAALNYSHEHGIIHRDFKPGNILFTEDDTPVLSDFGIAKPVQADASGGRTAPHMVIGSWTYMSPEQKTGQKITPKVDVYALGLVCYEMLIGQLPEEGLVIESDAQAASLAKSMPALPEGAASVIADCLRAAPEERPSAADVSRRLTLTLRPPAKASRPAIAGISAAAALLIGALLYSQIAGRPHQLEVDLIPADANLYVDGLLATQTPLELEAGDHQLVAVHPDAYGEVRIISLTDDDAFRVALAPLSLPTFEQFREFSRQFGDQAALDDINPNAVSYPPFRRLLELRRTQLSGDTEAQTAMVGELNTLAAVGDPTAQFILFVANFDQVISGDRFSNLIQQASNSGYALATFYQALHYQWAHTGDDGMGIADMQVYRSLMARALDQGLVFADNYVRDADRVMSGL